MGPRQRYSVTVVLDGDTHDLRFETMSPKTDLRAIAVNGFFTHEGMWYPPHRVVCAQIEPKGDPA